MSSEYDVEPVRGLPALPPKGEHVLWRGAPDWKTLALKVFRVRGIALYFGVLEVWKLIGIAYDGGTLQDALAVTATLAVMAALAIAFFVLLAWAIGRSTVYTITNRRVVMRIGVALPVTFNLPFGMIDGAALRDQGAGVGDIPLQLRPGVRMAYLVMWPHVRPWRFSSPEPMLRCIPDAARTAQLLGEALAATLATGEQDALPAAAATTTGQASAPAMGRPALAAG